MHKLIETCITHVITGTALKMTVKGRLNATLLRMSCFIPQNL